MSLFSKTKVVLWPKSDSVDVYIDKKDNNIFSSTLNLFTVLTPTDLLPLSTYLKQQGITNISVLINDNLVNIRSFIYDSQITTITKEEVVKLAESFVTFKIDSSSLDFNLVQEQDKTIIRATIYDHKKMELLKANLVQLGLVVDEFRPVSTSVATIISSFAIGEYFLLYPLSSHEHTLVLSRGPDVYLTNVMKGNSLEVQKNINYSNLYFSSPTQKIYLSSRENIEVSSTTTLEKTPFDESQIAIDFGKPSNLPLPVLGLFSAPSGSKPAIIKPSAPKNTSSTSNMDNKKNILSIVAVFIFTAALASVIIWFVLNRNNSNVTSPTGEVTQNITPTVEVLPTEMPTPTAAPIVELDKKLKLQVLNATDINGQAASLKEKLVKLGFTSAAVGNSADKTATVNVVKYKAALTTVPDYFKAKLGDYFPATYSPELTKTSTYDVVFIIGTNLSTAGAMPEITSEDSVVPTSTKALVSPTATKSASITPTKKLTPTVTE